MIHFVTAYLLSLFAAIFTGNCESQLQDPAVDSAVSTYGLVRCDFVQVVQANNDTEEKNTPKREETQLAFEENNAFLAEIFFTLGEKYEGSSFKLVFVQVLEHEIVLPCFERACSFELPNQPTLVVLKVILQV